MYCEKCGNALGKDFQFCTKCGKQLSKESDASCENANCAKSQISATERQSSYNFTGQYDGRYFVNGVDVTGEDFYWQEEFIKIYQSNGGYAGKFNWAAFFFGALWFFAKGLPVAGLIWMAIALIGGFLTFGLLAIATWVVVGFRANYIRYKSVIEKTEIYF